MNNDMTVKRPWRNFYGRVHGKTLRDSQRGYLDNELGGYQLANVSWEENPERNQLDIEALTEGKPLWLEIGFGGGEHLVHQAENNPDCFFIGCEPFINGVAMLLGKIKEKNLKNLRIHPGDVRDLFDVLPSTSVDRVFLLYPDPWPKKRHHRRRFVTPDYLNPLAQVMKPHSELRIATDIEDYVRQSLQELAFSAHFEWLACKAEDWQTPWAGWYSTRYEQKALREGRTPHYLQFKRL